MTAKFIISFDCEGKWGYADYPQYFRQFNLTNDILNKTYGKLRDILAKWDIRGTFAFVGAFTMSVDEYQKNKELFMSESPNYRAWLKIFFDEISRNHYDGWFNPTALEIIAQEHQHEIAGHGFTHIPLTEFYISKEEFHQELDNLQKTAAFSAREINTFIYPRNLIGYVNELKRNGIIGYRAGEKINYKGTKIIFKDVVRIKNLISEFNIWRQAQPCLDIDTIIAIPAGLCLNWRYGIRRYIPKAVTLKMWRHIIDNAIQNDSVIHLYTHPHNFVTGDQMFELLDNILASVYSAQKKNKLINVTQREYAESIRNMGGNVRP
jgi:hypothetical protein